MATNKRMAYERMDKTQDAHAPELAPGGYYAPVTTFLVGIVIAVCLLATIGLAVGAWK